MLFRTAIDLWILGSAQNDSLHFFEWRIDGTVLFWRVQIDFGHGFKRGFLHLPVFQ